MWFFQNWTTTYFKWNKDDWTWEININPGLDIKRTYRHRNPNFATCRPFLEKLLKNAIQWERKYDPEGRSKLQKAIVNKDSGVKEELMQIKYMTNK